jgi:hypothetical protein
MIQASIQRGGPALEVQAWWVELNVLSTHKAVHKFKERGFTLAFEAVVVINLEQCKCWASTIGDEHRPFGSGPLGG